MANISAVTRVWIDDHARHHILPGMLEIPADGESTSNEQRARDVDPQLAVEQYAQRSMGPKAESEVGLGRWSEAGERHPCRRLRDREIEDDRDHDAESRSSPQLSVRESHQRPAT